MYWKPRIKTESKLVKYFDQEKTLTRILIRKCVYMYSEISLCFNEEIVL